MVKKNQPLNQILGFFDIDSRELSSDGLGLEFQDRVKPISDKLNLLYDFAYNRQLMFVFSICCSGKFLKKGSLDYVCRVPIDGQDDAWLDNIENRRYFCIEKKQYGNPRLNCEKCAYDFFKYNLNAAKLLKILKIKTWVLFGNGFDICVRAAAGHLLKNKFKLIVLEDAVAPAYGPGNTGTKENKKKILSELKKQGAKIMDTGDFLKKYA